MCLKTVVVCVLIVLLVDFVCNTEALDEGGDGVCIVKLSSPQRRKKPYNVAINKWCGRRKCVVKKYRFETYLAWTNHTVCCNGWQHDSDLDICAPICSTGCLGGKCVSPDQCQCDSPSYLDPERPNTCITPDCSPTCVNAVCHVNNTCICKQDYSPYNSTHCFKCDPGYTADENLNCVPICDQACVNSTCTAPNTCTCFDGFRPKNESTCEPICDCVNADCVAPNTCSCFKGYVAINKTVCTPRCNSCSNGDCVGPNNCSCHTGYVKINGDCKPQCSKTCVNGICTAPNVCSCKSGFVRSNTSDNVCVIPCDDNCNGYCDEFGGCVKWNCSSTPIRGKGRTLVKKLICCKKYEYDVELDKCMPICRYGCINGTCTDVDTCHCERPLILVNNACVQPTCTGCEHGDCVGNNICECHEHYIKANNTCIPNCDSVCVNGVCSEPNKCKCNFGYKPDPNDKFNCIPICDHECVNGFCVSHNKCICSAGYTSTNDSFVCKPECYGCEFGECVAPNNCSCFAGYERMNSTCEPKCSACDNGVCLAPGNCLCNEGYHLTESGCMPTCSVPCINGHCSAPNFCSCKDGYIKDDINHSLCYKPCDRPCSNGTCDLHGQCKCFADFYFDEDTKTCTPVKPIECSTCNGTCSEDNKDECRCANKTLCFMVELPPEPPAPSTKMAGMDLTLISIGGACLLLLILVVIVMQRIWHKRNEYGENKPTNENTGFGSVVYTVPHTLIQPRTSIEFEDHDVSGDDDATAESLLRTDKPVP